MLLYYTAYTVLYRERQPNEVDRDQFNNACQLLMTAMVTHNRDTQ